MAETLFPDLSEYQPNADIAGIRRMTGAISARLLYGLKLDKMMPGRISSIRGQNFDAVIWYVFMRASSITPVSQQALAVRNLIPNLLPGEAVAVDWEADPSKVTPSTNDRDLLLNLLDNIYSQPTILYASASALSGYMSNRPVWAAAYGISEPRVVHQEWQYTDGKYSSGDYTPVNWPGAGFCDTSVFHDTSQAMGAAISKGVPQMYDPAIVVENVVADLGCPTGGAWTLAASGAVDAWGGAPYLGGANNRPYFVNRKAAKLVLPNPEEASAGKRYVIVDTAGERYAYPE